MKLGNMTGLNLFFNNDTILYGVEQLKPGMTKDEALWALEHAGFAPGIAKAFMQDMLDKGNAWLEDGTLRLPDG